MCFLLFSFVANPGRACSETSAGKVCTAGRSHIVPHDWCTFSLRIDADEFDRQVRASATALWQGLVLGRRAPKSMQTPSVFSS